MGVHGLWDLLAPVGRRVSVETLAGKRLAIDASIWMIQFMKAMRDEKGEMVRNAHLLGFFRRICKLLYLRTKPIFVFDGGTPALKRRTVIARRRQRENAQAKIRKTAEKLLLNQLKQIRLKELANELEKQRKDNNAKRKTVVTIEELEKQNRGDDSKGKKVITDETEMGDTKSGGNHPYADRYNQEAVDEMLAASLFAEEDEVFTVGESSSALHAQTEEEDADEDEEMILPIIHGKVDPTILASLPPSMQLDLLVQMRERLMAENRQKYQKVKKVPARFSELQIEAYLKTVAFRREIDEVQKSAAGQGIGGVQTSRIASEANREFIFSSSFSGDKQILTSAGEGRRTSHASAPTATSSGNTVHVTLMKNSIAASESANNEPQTDLDNDIETYLDERGRHRVSRVRAMGIRMTRDIQRNLDLMKEFEKETGVATENASNESTIGGSEVEAVADTPNGIQLLGDSDYNTDGITSVNNKNEEKAPNTGCAIEISFENNGKHERDDADDDIFARLVAGAPVLDFSVDNSPSKKRCSDSTSECEWEEGGTLSNNIKVDGKPLAADGGMDDDNELEWEEAGDFSIDIKVDKTPAADGAINHDGELEWDEGGTLGNGAKGDSKLLVADGGMIDEGEIDWKEGSPDIQEEASCPAECRTITSRGDLEEEADLREAIRRSLLDLVDQRSLNALHEHKKSIATAEMSIGTDMGFLPKEDPKKPEVSPECKFEEQNSVPEHAKRIDSTVELNTPETSNPVSPPLVNCEEMEVATEKTCQRHPNEELLKYDACKERNLLEEVLAESVAMVQEKDVSQITEQLMNTSGSAMNDRSSETTVLGKASVDDSVKVIDTAREVADQEASDYISMEIVEPFHNSASLDGKKQIEITEASLEEEMLILCEEERALGDEQRKLERNAESVSSEMFAECQELLQIFGLPFIIAPMEAEAQCAYMELSNLVDGVVTDDSDAFLFGAQSVYKNIFDDRKYVETYFMKDIANELGLNREKLINMALLLGSDYTEGVSGIGIVNAIEVVNAFPEEDGLYKFREWIESPDPSILGKCEAQAGVNLRKRESKVGDTDMSCSESKGVDETQKIKQIFMDKHRNVSKNWHIPSSFPSDAVISAYTSPQVDKSVEPFSWGKPDHFILRKLCWEKFGWSTQKADELLLTVLTEYNKRETQLQLEAFYTFNERFAKIRSKRIKKALKGMTENKSLDLMDEPGPRSEKRIVNQGGDAIGDESEKALEGRNFEDAGNEPNGTEKSIKKKSRKKRAQKESLYAVGSRKQSSIETESCQNLTEELIRKGRGGGKGRNESTGKRRKKSGSPRKYAESCSNDESNNYNGNESQLKFEGQCQVRRSERPRKNVDYTMINDSSDQDDGNSQNEKSERRTSSADMLDAGDAVTSPSKINRSEIVDQEFPRESLEKGAWFCTDKSAPETRVIESSFSKNDDVPAVGQLSNDYQTTGGGFCLDEDDANVDYGGQGCPTRATTLDSDLPNHSNSFDDRNCTSNPSPSGTKDRVQQEERWGRVDTCHTKRNADDTAENNHRSLLQKIPLDGDAVNEPVRSLRAMPNLRKKRRKS